MGHEGAVTLDEVMKRADVVIATTGAKGLIKPDTVRRGQIVLALSNPDPEIEPALARVTADCTVVSVDTDRLYPPRLADELHAALPLSTREHITSVFGHDGFLIEENQVGRIIRDALARDAR